MRWSTPVRACDVCRSRSHQSLPRGLRDRAKGTTARRSELENEKEMLATEHLGGRRPKAWTVKTTCQATNDRANQT